jgi:phage gpG-like protein
MTYLDRLIKATMKSIPGYQKPEIFNHSIIRFEMNGLQSGVDERGNPVYEKTILEVKAILFKKPRINKVTQRLDRVSFFEVYEGNVISPQDFHVNLAELSEGEITGDAIINGVKGKARLVSTGKGYLEAYNKLVGRVTVDTKDLKRWVGSATKYLRDLSQPMEAAKSHFQDKISRQFQTETDPYGSPWEPLKPETLAKKKGGSILVRAGYGWLRDSFVYIVDKSSLKIYSKSKVFEAHQLGISPVPKREMLGISPEDKNEIARRTRVYVGGIKK